MEDIKRIEKFKNLLLATHREGVEELLDWVATTDFYTAPASTLYHDACIGGLLRHSIAVYDWLLRLAGFYKSYVPKVELSGNSVTIVALCHDFCKIGCYKTDMRWRKDRMGRWEQYPTYKFEEDFHFGGHGSKSVYLIQHFIKLTPLEAAAINSHMGAWDKSTYGNPSAVYEVNPLAWLLHVADEAASYQKEEE